MAERALGPGRVLVALAIAAVVILGVAWLADVWRPGMPASARGDDVAEREPVLVVDPLAEVAPATASRSAAPGDAHAAGPAATSALRVLSTSGDPVGDLDVLIQSVGGSAELSTDAEGLARTDLPLPWRVVTRAEGFAPTRHRIHEESPTGVHDVRIEREAVLLAGTCWLDDALPGKPLDLHLIPSGGTVFPDGELNEREQSFLTSGVLPFEALVFRCDARGVFTLRGAGISELVRAYATRLTTLTRPIASGTATGFLGRGVEVRLPEGSLQLYAYSSAHELYGRCLIAGSGAPAAGTGIVARIATGSGAWDYASTTVEADGSFRLQSATPRPSQVDLSIGSSIASKPTAQTLLAETTAFPDLGTLFVERARYAELLVQDDQGNPLAGARIAASGLQADTNAEGRVRLPASDADAPSNFTVSALGYEPHSASVVLEEGRLHVVRLERANRLRIRLTLAGDGRPLPDYGVRGATADLPDPSRGPIGTSSSVNREAGTIHLWTDAAGEVELFAVPVGRNIALDVLDPHGFALERVAVEPLASGEERDVAFAIRAEPKSFAGLVTAADGAPLAGIDVAVSAPGGRASYWSTDLAGRFEVGEFCGASAQVVAEGSGWLETTQLFEPVHEGMLVTLVLEPSTSLVVELRAQETFDPADAEVRAHAADSEQSWKGFARGGQRWVLEDLPRARLRLEASTGRLEARTEVDTRVTRELVLEMRPRRE